VVEHDLTVGMLGKNVGSLVRLLMVCRSYSADALLHVLQLFSSSA
jgi:hypothetical protein